MQTTSRRDRAKHRRRRRILDEARSLLAGGGFDALNLRSLAAAAEVTVPTIYNLVGNKEDVVVALLADALEEIEQRAGSHAGDGPLERATAVVTESVSLFGSDEEFYRAALIALDYLDGSAQHHDTAARIYVWAEQLLVEGFDACRRAGLLRDRIDADLLAAHIVRSYRTSSRAWALGQLDIDAFRAAALADVYLSLAADAVETFHATLMKKIAALPRADSRQPLASTTKGKE
ncbi:MAG: TetR/AcrR family transcriptional regulator [Gammaproteobacteria bacterium]